MRFFSALSATQQGPPFWKAQRASSQHQLSLTSRPIKPSLSSSLSQSPLLGRPSAPLKLKLLKFYPLNQPKKRTEKIPSPSVPCTPSMRATNNPLQHTA